MRSELLLSGFGGAIIAVMLTRIYQSFSELRSERRKLFIEIICWADNLYDLIQALHVQKDTEGNYLSQEEYNDRSRELKTLLLSSQIKAKTHLFYGPGKEVKLINAFNGELLEIARILWKTKIEDWPGDSKKIEGLFHDKVDDLKGDIVVAFSQGTKSDNPLFFLTKESCPTFYRYYKKLQRYFSGNKK